MGGSIAIVCAAAPAAAAVAVGDSAEHTFFADFSSVAGASSAAASSTVTVDFAGVLRQQRHCRVNEQ